MKRTNPILLDVLTRAGAYPVGDFRAEYEGASPEDFISAWVIPLSPVPITLLIAGNGTHVDPLVQELRGIGSRLALFHDALESGSNDDEVWTLEISFMCSNVQSRIFDRQIRPRNRTEWQVGLLSHLFVHWFDPNPNFHGQPFDFTNLPAIEIDDVPATASRAPAAPFGGKFAYDPDALSNFDDETDDELLEGIFSASSEEEEEPEDPDADDLNGLEEL